MMSNIIKSVATAAGMMGSSQNNEGDGNGNNRNNQEQVNKGVHFQDARNQQNRPPRVSMDGATNTNQDGDVTMSEPQSPQAQKRAAERSPHKSPSANQRLPKDAKLSAKFPVALDESKMEEPHKDKAPKGMSKEEKISMINDHEWTGELWEADTDNDNFAELVDQGVDRYEFKTKKKGAKESMELLRQCDYFELAELLGKKASNHSKPTQSAAHVSKGPFCLRRVKATRALRVKFKDVKLNTGSYTFETDPLTYVSLCRNQEAIIALLTAHSGVAAAKPSGTKMVVKMSPEDGNSILYARGKQLGNIEEWLERGWRELESNRQEDIKEEESEKCKNQSNQSTAKESDDDSSDNSAGDSRSNESGNHQDEEDSDGTSSIDEVEVVEEPSTSQKGKQGKPKVAKPIPIKLGVRTWDVDDDTDGENAYGSDNEIPLNQTLLKD
eukprot:scaffold61018_cov52-Cyclotella_meneghiniana.AAC.12